VPIQISERHATTCNDMLTSKVEKFSDAIPWPMK